MSCKTNLGSSLLWGGHGSEVLPSLVLLVALPSPFSKGFGSSTHGSSKGKPGLQCPWESLFLAG